MGEECTNGASLGVILSLFTAVLALGLVAFMMTRNMALTEEQADMSFKLAITTITTLIICVAEAGAVARILIVNFTRDLFDTSFGGFTVYEKAKLGRYSAKIAGSSNISSVDSYDLVQIRGSMKPVGIVRALLCKKGVVTENTMLIVPRTRTVTVQGKVSLDGSHYKIGDWSINQACVDLEGTAEVKLQLKTPLCMEYALNIINECIVVSREIVA